MNLLEQIDCVTSMRIYKKLLDKCFKCTIYREQKSPNIWYKIEFTDEENLRKFINLLKEDIGYWEWSFDNIRLSIEIREDLSEIQYLMKISWNF